MKLLILLLACLLCLSSHSKTLVNDVTNINPIEVNRIVTPLTTADIVSAVRSVSGSVSIGGGRFSMGGQTATENSIQIDMRTFNKVIHLDVNKKQITVQAGIRWRDVQEELDKRNLAVKIMQTYSNFTVGGSLSVNCHGRYIGEGPLIRSVESIKVILADGKEVFASRTENSEIFFSAIGGYGGIGVISEATLNLADNEKIERSVKVLPALEYKKYFFENIRENKDVILHNGDLYPPDYKTVSAVSWHRSNKPLTVEDRLIPRNQNYSLLPNALSLLSTIPFGTEIRPKIDSILYKSSAVVWRNYEASYDVAQLEPSTPRLLFTYVLQEYFAPVDKFDDFISKMRMVFQKHKVNVVNVSIRHSLPDSGSYLAWAPEEVFAFVVYYKQRTNESSKKNVKKWTRELIDEVISMNGRYYLPYQIHASEKQFKKAYPNFQKFFDVKKKVDPTNKFRNKLWDAYYTEKK